MKAIARSPAKVILFGEHFVVGGNSAISMAIDLPTILTTEPLGGEDIQINSEDLGVKAVFSANGELARSSGSNAEATLRPVFEAASFTLRKINRERQGLRITVKSKVPIGMGLGSSAATAVATVSAITTLFDAQISREGIFEAAYSLERLVHGRPSGVDQATVTYGGLICYRKGTVDSTINVAKPPELIIGNTGKRRSTGEFVGRVTRLRETNPEKYATIASKAQQISERAIDALKTEDEEKLGNLMDENQKLLELVGVSSPELERLITAARSAGALGSKLTGGGGGGCMIALVTKQDAARIAKSVEQAGGIIIPSSFVPDGVQARIQKD